MEEHKRFDSWAVIDLFGHQKIAGRATEQAIGGASFVRIDVPEVDGSPAFTKLFGAAAIYSITPVTEDLARKAVKACHSEPISVYIPQERQIESNAGKGELCKHGLHFCEVCDRDADRDEDFEG